MTSPEPEPGTAELWPAYLDHYREQVAAGVLALPAEQHRVSRVPSGWSPLELLSHVLHMEQRWFVWGFLGEPVAEPWGDWDGDPDEAGSRWHVPDGVTAEQLVGRLRAVGRRTTEVLRAHGLDEAAALGGRFSQDPPRLEWICFHVLQEYARHAGHLDIAVELGAAGYAD